MGTRAVTNVVDEAGNQFVSLYRQYDGYLMGGHGEELADFLTDIRIGNGISGSDTNDPKFFNGVGDLAIRLVTNFKQDNLPGSFYLIPLGEDWGPDYVYTVRVSASGVEVKVDSWSKSLFMGSVEEFRAWMKEDEEGEDY